MLTAVEVTHKNSELELLTENPRVFKVLTSRIPTWEDKGYVGVSDPELMRALVAKIRLRTAKTFISKSSGSEIEEASSVARTSLHNPDIPVAKSPDVHIPDYLHIQGAKLSTMTQTRAYKMIRATKKVKPRKKTEQNIKLVQEAIKDLNGDAPKETEIWRSIRSNDLLRRQRNFLYMAMHGAHKIGSFWKHVTECEAWGICQHCQTTENMEHILLECRRPGQSELWNVAQLLWNQRGRYKPGLTRFFHILVAETAHTIWKVRCATVLNWNNIHNMWVNSMNEPIPIKMVLNTWSGALRDEASLPDSWIWEPRVLVGVEPITNHHNAVQRPMGRRGRNH
ncbi:hypothetical protein C8J56DRAFT_1003250 [Mycena floridula]|nr:hypothetical protein C8J56DRAFT_1003250 [Mycena floridula]